MSLTLLGLKNPINSRLHKILIAARFANLTVDLVPIHFGVDNESKDWYNNCHPMGRTPVLQTDEGYVFESRAILRYIARQDKGNGHLYGRTAFEASQIDSWLDYSGSEFVKEGEIFLSEVHFGVTHDAEKHKAADDQCNSAFFGLDNWLENRTFLVGERLSIADIEIACTIDWIFRFAPNGDAYKSKYKNAWRHYMTVMNQPKTVEVLQSQDAEIGCVPRKEAKKAAAPAPKKEEKKEKKAEKEDDGNDDFGFEEEKPKAKNPLDLLPPPKMVMDEWKRFYSNNNTRGAGGSAEWFQKNFDNEGYTAFWCYYKYNEENKKAFMTGNLVRGWFQRMDHLRKHAFGSVLITGTDAKHEIVGFWFFRGKGMADVIKEVDDIDLFDWVEVPDITKEADRITDFLAHDGESFATRPVLEGRVFK